MTIEQIINLEHFAVSDIAFMAHCRCQPDREGVVVLPRFLGNSAVEELSREGRDNQHKAYFTTQRHNVYVTEPNTEFPDCHPIARQSPT